MMNANLYISPFGSEATSQAHLRMKRCTKAVKRAVISWDTTSPALAAEKATNFKGTGDYHTPTMDMERLQEDEEELEPEENGA